MSMCSNAHQRAKPDQWSVLLGRSIARNPAQRVNIVSQMLNEDSPLNLHGPPTVDSLDGSS